MTTVESIILSGAARAKIRNSAELARRSGVPVSTMRDKMNHPEKIRLSDLAAWNRLISFSDDELGAMVRMCK